MESIKISKVDQVRLERISHRFKNPTNLTLTGSLHLTTHHLIFKPNNNQSENNHNKTPTETLFDQTSNHEIWITHTLLSAIEHLPSNSQPTLLVRLITFITYTLTFDSSAILDDVWESLKSLVYNRKQGEKESTYAFINSKNIQNQMGWNIYDPVTEFQRLKAIGPNDSAWRLTNINHDFNFCSTYPTTLLVPAKISDTTLSYAVKYRSKGRLPIGTYVHWSNGSSITRSSQPMVGFKNARSIQDEKLIEAIFHSHSLHTGPRPTNLNTPNNISVNKSDQQVIYGATSTNLIIDARPTTNAMANTVKGAGTENMENYKGCRKAYLGIDNIHVMRDSLNKLTNALHESFITGFTQTDNYKKTNWLKHITAILDGTSQIVKTIHISNSHVLIHCSDGWDRTSQLSSLSQICLDPFYRTFKGFSILIEKDWLSFGHKFSDRSGIVLNGREIVKFSENRSNDLADEDFLQDSNNSNTNNWVTNFQKQLNFGNSTNSLTQSHAFKETSPVFHQFLDCVYQLLNQFPKRFEFNSNYLQRLHESLYSGEFGTFLFDSEFERIKLNVKEKTKSIWEIFQDDKDLKFYLNDQYDSNLDDPCKGDMGVLLVDPKSVIFWSELFGIDHQLMNPPPPPLPTTTTIVERSSTSTPPLSTSSRSRLSRVGEGSIGSNQSVVVNDIVKQETNQTQRLPSYLTAPLRSSRELSNTNNVVNISGEQIQSAIQTAKTVGWSTWDRLKRGYEEATKVSSSISGGREGWEEEVQVEEESVNVENALGVGFEPNPWSIEDDRGRLKKVDKPISKNMMESHPDPWVSSSSEPVLVENQTNLKGIDPLGVGLS
ncbi:hypothetical protein CROQUDRAFT_134376 [Cronartium quercuum f. sp. fusiforme G11]|uniref:Myotubularin phosphatase domain-containing protein n=1 Tax=Cronartium quercuum f. sp. fusiforme G11 TaxID=708437 RepID=A0A9P6NIY8_9BASI|nr:hypothetical protein CROQUDRAFT_134376 [Cronartium quercuum f. sp. fusiforme G11]